MVALLLSCAACADDQAGTQPDESDCAVRTLSSDAAGAVAISVTGAGPCSAIAGVLEIDNRSGGECGSDINAIVEAAHAALAS